VVPPGSGGRVVLGVVRVVLFGRRRHRDVRGAHPVAVGDGGQALHISSQHLFEGACFRLAQLRELGGHVGHRAVVLTQLDAGHLAPGAAGDLGGGSVSVTGQCAGEGRRACGERRIPVDLAGQPAVEL